MSNTNLKYVWLIVLSVLWLSGAFPTIEEPLTSHSVSYAEVTTSPEVSVFDISQNQKQLML